MQQLQHSARIVQLVAAAAAPAAPPLHSLAPVVKPALARRDVYASVLQCARVSCTHSHCRFGVRRRLPLQDLGCKRRRRPSQLVRERRRGQRAMARSTWGAQARSPLSVSAPLAHSLLPPCMTTVLRVLACRSGRVAQVPFSSACFWRGLHFRCAM